jgi:signal transduction histidine kinase
LKEWFLEKKWRVVSSGIVMAAAPVMLLAFIVYIKTIGIIEDMVLKENRMYANLCANRIADKIKGDISFGRAYAARPRLIKGLLAGDKKEMRMHLKDLMDNSNTIERVFIASTKGVLLADYPQDPAVAGKDFSHREWYKGVLKSRIPYVSDFYMRTARPQRYLFAIAIPVRAENGNMIGILVMQPDEHYIRHTAADIRPGHGFIYVVDRRGNLVYHPLHTIDKIMDFSHMPAVSKLKKGMEGAEKIFDPETGGAVLTTYMPVRGHGLGVVVQVPLKDVFAPAIKMTVWIFGITGLMLILGGAFAYVWADQFVTLQRTAGELKELSSSLSRSNEELQAMNEEIQSMNQELQAQQKELSYANMRLEEASKAKSDFLANMSHELRTPLNSIIGFSEVMEDELYGKLNDKQKEYIRDIEESGRHLLNLINDILDLSKIESGRMELEPEIFNLKSALDGSMRMLKEKALRHSINLMLEIGPDADTDLEADERKFKQIMFNFLSNAVKFTGDGGSVTVTAKKAGDDFIEIAVADTGIGIKPEEMPGLFREFSQLDSAGEKKHEGSGLGLALTKRLIELHGGSVWAESEYGRGSKFSFRIPVRIFSGEPSITKASKIACVRGNKALVVDDDPNVLSALENLLKSAGCTVFTAANGSEGIELAKRELPDLIVLDLMMPYISGFYVIDALRSEPATAAIPIIVLTAMDLSKEEKNRLKDRVVYIERKGEIKRESFIAKVREALGR